MSPKYFYVMLAMCFLPLQLAQAATNWQHLPKPNVTGGKPLMQVLNQRSSVKSFDTAAISDQMLGEILWSAYGVNRKDGRRTIPTSMNRKDLEIYVIKADGAWIYDAGKHALKQVSEQDLRPLLALQGYVKNAPLGLVYVGKKVPTASLHAGSSYQNVSLYCASAGLNNVVRAQINAEKLAEELHLNEQQHILVSQSIGWPKK